MNVEVILEDAKWVKWVWTKDELATIEKMMKKGFNVREISEKIGENLDNTGLAMIHIHDRQVSRRKR